MRGLVLARATLMLSESSTDYPSPGFAGMGIREDRVPIV